MEEETSLKEVIRDLNNSINDIKTPAKTNKTFGSPTVEGYVFAVIIGGFLFTMLWIFWELTYGIIFGLMGLGITLFISAKGNDGKWRLPLKARFLGRRKKRKGYCVFMNIGTNKAVTFIKAPIEEAVAMVNGVPHIVEPEDILIWKNKIPIVITPQWSEKPFSAKDHFAKTNEGGMNTMGWQYIMNFIATNQLKEKKKVAMGLIIFGVIALVGLGYYLIKSGAFK